MKALVSISWQCAVRTGSLVRDKWPIIVERPCKREPTNTGIRLTCAEVESTLRSQNDLSPDNLNDYNGYFHSNLVV